MPALPAEEAEPALAVVVFSKDRPCQLEIQLASLLRHIHGAVLEIFVCYRASSSRYAESYRVLQALFSGQGANIHWERESDDEGRSLGDLIEVALGSCGAALFTVDDALWIDDFDAGVACRLLQQDASIFAVHPKLSPRIEFAQPNGRFMRVPPLSGVATPSTPSPALGGGASQDCHEQEAGEDEASAPPAQEMSFWAFERSRGEYDWNYPWDLSGSVYRSADAREVVGKVREEFGSDGVNHPNRLEGNGVRLIKQAKVECALRAERCACLTQAAVTVVTINRVQTFFDNPVYAVEGEDGYETELSVEELEHFLRQALLSAAIEQGVDGKRDVASAARCMAARTGLDADWFLAYWSGMEPPTPGGKHAGSPCLGMFDAFALLQASPRPLLREDAYRLAYLDCVHVPLLGGSSGMFSCSSIPARSASIPRALDATPEVSWLIPVFNAPGPWLRDALQSVSQQEGMGPGSWEAVVVDDCSTDEGTLAELAEWASRPCVRVIRTEENGGVARALNAGWRECRGHFVARLDADDIAHSSRLKGQLLYLEAHPSISVLGGGFRTFRQRGDLEREGGVHSLPYYRMPCHPLLARWRMLFSCSLAHPTVVFRRGSFPPDEGVYPEGEDAEDHCCWLSFPPRIQFANIADVVVFLRRHGASRSAKASEALRRSSYGAVRRFVAACARPAGDGCDAVSAGEATDFTEEDVAVLWGRANASSVEQTKRVSAALGTIERTFGELLSGSGESAVDLPQGFAEDFVQPRLAGLREYISAACSRLRGAIAVQSLADGDVSSGAEMMKLWLSANGAAPRSLGALLGVGSPAD